MYWKTVGCCAAEIWHTFWPIYIETSVSKSLDWPCFRCVLLTIHFPLQINGSNKHDQIPPTIASSHAINLVCDNCIFHIDLSRVSSPDGLVRHHLYVYLLCCTLPFYIAIRFFLTRCLRNCVASILWSFTPSNIRAGSPSKTPLSWVTSQISEILTVQRARSGVEGQVEDQSVEKAMCIFGIFTYTDTYILIFIYFCSQILYIPCLLSFACFLTAIY